MMRSPCCNAEVSVPCCSEHAKDRDGVTHWYACTACGQPCDPVEADFTKEFTRNEKEGEK